MKKQAVMLYIIKNDKILFLVRDKKNDTVHVQGKLVSIGGKVEDGESVEDAVKREAQEEANIFPINIDLRAIMYFRNFGIENHDWVSYLYTANDYKGTVQPGNEGTFIWKPTNEIDTLNLYKQDKIYLKLVLKHAFFAAEFVCDTYEMVDYKLLKAV